MLSQLGQVPAVAAKNADPHPRLHDGVDLTSNGQDQGGLAAAVGAQDGDMLTGTEVEVDVVENDTIATRHVYVFQFEKLILIDWSNNIACVLRQAIHIC